MATVVKAVVNGNELNLTGQGLQLSSSSTSNVYVLVALKDASVQTREAVERSGATFLNYVGSGVYLCRWDPSRDPALLQSTGGVLSVGNYPDSAKVTADLAKTVELNKSLSGAELGPTKIKVEIHFHTDTNQRDINRISQDLVAEQVIDSDATEVFDGMISTAMDPAKLPQAAACTSVRVIERAPNLCIDNYHSVELLGAWGPAMAESGYYREGTDVAINEMRYTGEGETISIADSGFDRGKKDNLADMSDINPAFSPASPYSFHCMEHENDAVAACFVDTSGHGTHVCGSALGSSQESVRLGPLTCFVTGTAPGATLAFTQLRKHKEPNPNNALFEGSMLEIYERTAKAPLPIFSNSWGSGVTATEQKVGYSANVEQFDSRIRMDDVLVCWSAGNDADSQPIAGNVGLYACGKNVLTVGACMSPVATNSAVSDQTGRMQYGANPKFPPGDPFQMGAFSCSTTTSGRQKPDLVAPGVCILSARSRDFEGTDLKKYGEFPDPRYCFKLGTSMATPMVAGCAAVLSQALKDTDNEYKPSGVLLKALLINGAVPLDSGGQYVKENPRSWGFGRVNLLGSFKHLAFNDAPRTYAWGILESGETETWNISVKASQVKMTDLVDADDAPSSRIKATLAYADEGHNDLVCALHIKIKNCKTGMFWFGNHNGWVTDQPDNFADFQNNVQQILCPAEIGEYQLSVTYFRNAINTRPRIPYGVAWLEL